MKCITEAWELHENELRNFLIKHAKDKHLADDLLQDVFVKALAKNDQFCTLNNTRAWLFRVTRNRLIDYFRTHKIYTDVPDDLAEDNSMVEPVVNLSKCLPTALKRLNDDDKEIIQLCDLDGMGQAEFARLKKLSTAGAKSRIQRARKRLKDELHSACAIVLDDLGNVCCFDPNCK